MKTNIKQSLHSIYSKVVSIIDLPRVILRRRECGRGWYTICLHNPNQKYYDDLLDFLLSCDIAIVSLADLLEEKAIDGQVAAITFDDGWKDVKELLVKSKHNVPVTIFMCTGEWDKRASLRIGDKYKKDVKGHYFMSVEDIRELLAIKENVSIQMHTHMHPVLTDITMDDLKADLIVNKNYIYKITNEEPYCLAYPHGVYPGDNCLELLKACGIKYAMSGGNGMSYIDQPYDIRRYGVYESDILKTKVRLSGIDRISNLIRLHKYRF